MQFDAALQLLTKAYDLSRILPSSYKIHVKYYSNLNTAQALGLMYSEREF